MYKYAAQNKLRFPTVRGDISVEDLFDLPLTSRTGFDLDSVAKSVNTKLKAATEESFVTVVSNPSKRLLEVSLDVVKDIIATKQAAISAANERIAKADKRQKILKIIDSKRDEQLSQASIEELTKQLED